MTIFINLHISNESPRCTVNGIIKAYSDKTGSGILELWRKHHQEITDPRVFRGTIHLWLLNSILINLKVKFLSWTWYDSWLWCDHMLECYVVWPVCDNFMELSSQCEYFLLFIVQHQWAVLSNVQGGAGHWDQPQHFVTQTWPHLYNPSAP